MKYLLKLDRYAAWLLFTCLLLYFITGFGMTKGIISPTFATKLHVNYLPYIILVAFVCHTGFATHLAFKRWRFWHTAGKIIWVLFYLAFIAFFIWANHFYVRKAPSINQNFGLNTNLANSSSAINASQNALKTFTLSELAQYDGQNGRPAYVAVDGIVYDVSSLFIGGAHFSHYAGQDLSVQFHSQHDISFITRYPAVGQLTK